MKRNGDASAAAGGGAQGSIAGGAQSLEFRRLQTRQNKDRDQSSLLLFVLAGPSAAL